MTSWYAMQHQRLQLKDNDNDEGGGGGGVGEEASSSWSSQSSFLRRRSNSASSKNRQRQQLQGGKSCDDDDDAMPTDSDLLRSDDKHITSEEEQKKKKEREEQKKSWRERSAKKKRVRDAKWRDLKLARKKKKEEKQAAADDDDADDDDASAFDVTDTDNNNDNTEKKSKADDSDDSDADDVDDADADAADESTTKKDDEKDDDKKKKEDKKKKKDSKYEVDILKLAPGERVPDPTCCRRYLSERNPCNDWYEIKDKLIGKRLDAPATFCPTSRRARIFKIIATTSVVAGNIMNFMEYRDLYGTLDLGFFVYLDNVGMVAAAVYMMLSMLNSILGARQPWDVVQGRMRWVWLAFIVASHTQVMMCIMYWSLVFPGFGVAGVFSFLNSMKYGGIAIEVILDGFTVNRIPLRWMNWWGLLWFMNLFYIFFFAPLYSFFFCSDLAIPGASTAIYPWLDWKGDWEFTLVAGVVLVFALSPAVFLILWLMSLYSWPTCFCCQKESRRYQLSGAQRRKLKEAKEAKKKEKEAQDEELALLKKDPMSLLPDKKNDSDSGSGSISHLFNRNRRPRLDNDDETVMSAGSASIAFQQDDVDLESPNDPLQHQRQQQQQQREEFQDEVAEASYNNGQEQEQAQPARAGWGRLGSLRSFLGSSVNNKNKTSNNNLDNSNDADSSVSSMTESHCYRSPASIVTVDDDAYVEDVVLDEDKYPWNDIMGGLSSDKKTTAKENNTKRSPVVGNLSLLDENDEDTERNDNNSLPDMYSLPNKEYKYPWDQEDSQGSLTYL